MPELSPKEWLTNYIPEQTTTPEGNELQRDYLEINSPGGEIIQEPGQMLPVTEMTQNAWASPKEWLSESQGLPKAQFVPRELTPVPVSDPEESTSIPTIALASLVKNPEAKIKIFAKARGIPIEDYGILNDEIVFRGPDNNLYREETSGFFPAVKRVGVQMLSDPATAGAVVGGVLGSPGGPVGTVAGEALGGAMGEVGRQQIAEKFMGEKRTSEENAIDVGTTVGLGLAGEGVMRAGKWGVKKALKNVNLPTTARLKEITYGILSKAGIFEPQQIKNIIATEEKANRFGINLNVAEKSEDIRLLSQLKNVSSPEIKKQLDNRAKELVSQVPKFINDVLPSSNKEPSLAVRNYVRDEMNSIPVEISKIVSPFYESALESNPKIDTTSIRDLIKSLTKDSTIDVKRALKDIDKDLYHKKPASSILIQGDEAEETTTNEISLKALDQLKKKIDLIVSGKYTTMGQKSYPKTISADLEKIKDALLESADSVSPDYKRAREIASLLFEGTKKLESLPGAQDIEYAELGDKLLKKKGLLTSVSNISDENLRNVGSYIFSTEKATPETVRAIKEVVLNRKDGKNVWNGILSNYMRYKLGEIPKVSGRIRPDIGGEMWNALFGTENKTKMMAEALNTDQYDNMYDFFDIIRRTGMITPPGISGVAQSEIKENFKSPILRMVRPFISKEYEISRGLEQLHTDKGMKFFVDTISDPEIGSKLQMIKKELGSSKNKDAALNQLIRVMGWSLPNTAYEKIMGE
jgi:hypothetical protein